MPEPDPETESGPIELLEAGKTIENSAGRCYLVTRRYAVDGCHGVNGLDALLRREPSGLARMYPAYGLEQCSSFRNCAFLDIESTGLGGGAGIYAFMVGVGRFEERESDDNGGPERIEFVLRQLFMRHPGEEPALLTALTQLLSGCQALVTFNGRSFDGPLLKGRYHYASRILPESVRMPCLLEEGAAHLDLLHPARRLWRRRLGSCALGNLEQALLGRVRTEADVAGSLIPLLYANYLRDGDARMMQRVFYHNREDILTMAALAELIFSALAEPTSTGPAHLRPLDLLSLARIQADLGQQDLTEALYRAALDRLRGRVPLAEAFDGLGRLLKRQRRWEEAVTVWRQWLTTAPGAEGGSDTRPYVELAKYCEWQSGDISQAIMWTQWALHEVAQNSPDFRSAQIQAELRHRLARLERKREARR